MARNPRPELSRDRVPFVIVPARSSHMEDTKQEATMWLSRAAAAQRLGLSSRSFDRLRHAPGFPTARRFGTALRFSVVELDAWANAQVQHPLAIPEPVRSLISTGVARGPQRRRAA